MADEINEPAGGAFERLKGKAKEVAGIDTSRCAS